jgi:anti-anti-sigma factor
MTNDVQKFHLKLLTTPEANVLYVTGELDLGTAGEFRNTIEPLAAEPSVPLTLNLRELTYIDSTGIGILVSVLKIRQAARAPFVLQEVPPKIRRLLDMTGLTKFLTIEGGGA